MKKNISIILAVCSLFILVGCELMTSKTEMRHTYENRSVIDSECGSNLFPHDETEPPCEGNGSPFDVDSTTNIIFHQWSWQKFLWLTKPMQDGTVLFENHLSLVDNNMMPVTPIDDVSLVLTDSTQADGGVLLSNPKYSTDDTSHTVYYSIHTNDILQDSAELYKDQIIAEPSVVNNDFVFPVGSLELKISWINENAIPEEKRSNYYIREAIVKGSKEQVALLGMHVVGVVKNHPEFIWATFEHAAFEDNGMAPQFSFSYPDQGNGYLYPVTSSNQKLFYKQGYRANNDDITFNQSAPFKPQNVFTLFNYGVPKYTLGSPGSRGMFTKSSQNEPVNYNNIKTLNTYVRNNLDGVWKNYFYNGSIWLDTDGMTEAAIAKKITSLGNGIKNASPGAMVRGSVAAFNITMETFFQSSAGDHLKYMPIKSVNNCFSCHTSITNIKLGAENYNKSNSPLYLSHIFRRFLSKSSNVSEENIEILRREDLRRSF
ncbi:MAG: hypothetical protein HRT35_19830 [Algicola sp.]|nr:hypothetical protein [Algicola sp.]